MRTTIVIIATLVVLAFLWYGTVLDDRRRRKTSKGGVSFFSLRYQFRALATKESLLLALLTLAMAGSVAALTAMDKAGYFGPP
jgi:hypothetical protein